MHVKNLQTKEAVGTLLCAKSRHPLKSFAEISLIILCDIAEQIKLSMCLQTLDILLKQMNKLMNIIVSSVCNLSALFEILWNS